MIPKKRLRAFLEHNIIQAIKQRDNKFIWGDFFSIMIFEEVVFRFYILGIILTIFFNQFIAIIISSFIFSVYHIQMYKKFQDKILVGIIMISETNWVKCLAYIHASHLLSLS